MHNASRLISDARNRFGDNTAFSCGEQTISFLELDRRVELAAQKLSNIAKKGSRVAIFKEKRLETVIVLFAAWRAGLIAVPVNPVLKRDQVVHILADSGASLLVTTSTRLALLDVSSERLENLTTVLFLDDEVAAVESVRILSSHSFVKEDSLCIRAETVDSDPAAILYTSGSTGSPKGVVLSHRNLIAGAASVVDYIGLTSSDVILSLLPLSFDAGLSQVTTAVMAGACCDLLNYLHPSAVIRRCAEIGVTAITGVPPLWHELASHEWDEGARTLRIFANTGGHMPLDLLQKLRIIFPEAQPFLMYGLTEAFRSTYLPPEEVDKRPSSIGKAVPNAEVVVVNSIGDTCQPWEHGELVHRGACVTLGYWNRPEENKDRFRIIPSIHPEIAAVETVVRSGDIAYTDQDGFIYFVGRSDGMIKTSGYRISPTEIESLVYQSSYVSECIAFGIPHETKGQEIRVVASLKPNHKERCEADIIVFMKQKSPSYMVPSRIDLVDSLPRTENGKIDRKSLIQRAIAATRAGEPDVFQAG